jgi:hypothetical protein
MMSSIFLNASLIVVSAGLFLLVFLANEAFFNSQQFEFVRGVNWIYLPAGMRLLCTLAFGEAGAIGILIASWITCVFYFFPDDPLRSFAGGIASAVAPYLVYRLALKMYGLDASLTDLNAKRLLLLTLMYSIANPTLHHLWLMLRGDAVQVSGFAVMVLGDLLGTLFVLYSLKLGMFLFSTISGRQRNH